VARRLGFAVCSVPVPWSDVAGSKIRWHTPLAMLLDVIRISLLYRVGVWRLGCGLVGPREAGASSGFASAADTASSGHWSEGQEYYEEALCPGFN
jgi:hypothetical protein